MLQLSLILMDNSSKTIKIKAKWFLMYAPSVRKTHLKVKVCEAEEWQNTGKCDGHEMGGAATFWPFLSNMRYGSHCLLILSKCLLNLLTLTKCPHTMSNIWWLYCCQWPLTTTLNLNWLLISSCSFQRLKPMALKVPSPPIQIIWGKSPHCSDALCSLAQQQEVGRRKVQVDRIFWFLAYTAAKTLAKWHTAKTCCHGYVDSIGAKDLSHIWGKIRAQVLVDKRYACVKWLISG